MSKSKTSLASKPLRYPALISAVIFCLTALTSAAYANTDCPEHFLNGQPPRSTTASRIEGTTKICYQAFALLFSNKSMTSLWSAEHLTRAGLNRAKSVKRVDAFHPDYNLPEGGRSELSDFLRSGMDKGHLTPSADAPTPESQRETFSLANMIPQNSNNNQNLWSNIEESVRRLAKERGELYVVTGPLYEGANLQRLKGRVLVPTGIFKAVYIPSTGQASAYIADNKEGMEYRVVSIAELTLHSGFVIFPALSTAALSNTVSLPPPVIRERANRNNYNAVGAETKANDIYKSLKSLF